MHLQTSPTHGGHNLEVPPSHPSNTNTNGPNQVLNNNSVSYDFHNSTKETKTTNSSVTITMPSSTITTGKDKNTKNSVVITMPSPSITTATEKVGNVIAPWEDEI